MRGHLRLASPWRQLGMFLGLFCLSYLIVMFLSLIVYRLNGIEHIDWNNPRVVSVTKFLQGISSVLLFVLPVYIFTHLTFTGKYGYFLGFKPAEKSNMYVLASVGILLAMPFVLWLGDINQRIPLPAELLKLEEESTKQMIAFLKVNSSLDIVINVFIIALLPAFCEEIFFRSGLQRIIIQIAGKPWAGIVITAILFSAIHMQFQGFLPRVFLGIVLGAFYWFSGSIWTSIVAHFVNNAVQVLAASYAPVYIEKNPEVPAMAAVASGIVIWAIMWYFQKQSTITYARVYQTDELTPTNQYIA